MVRPKKLPKFVKLVKPEKVHKNIFDVKALAEAAAKSAALPLELGPFVESIEEGTGFITYFWKSKQPGYVDWSWAVTISQISPSTEPTICEVVLVASDKSLAAPKWIPWSERLADYKALQAELEKQAALDAAEELAEIDGEELPVSDSEESENSEQ